MVHSSPTFARIVALGVPLAVAAALALLRDVLANTSAALVLVLVLVAVAAFGDRVAGMLAALSVAACFDFFLTRPFYGFAIAGRDDVETAVLLAVIGVAVTEIVQWGRRHQARSTRHDGYLTGLHAAARLAAEVPEARDRVDRIARMIAEVLDLDACRHEPAPYPRVERPRLERDGTVTWRGRPLSVERNGLPTDDVIELPAGPAGEAGIFLLVASTRVRRPHLDQRLVAVTLAQQAALPALAPPTAPPRSSSNHSASGWGPGDHP